MEKRYLVLAGVSVVALLLIFVRVNEVSTTGAFFANEIGVNYDVELCIRKGYEEHTGVGIDAVGVIGCPLDLVTGCNGNLVCEDFELSGGFTETQTSCPTDCKTTAMIPSPVLPLENVLVTVDFRDGRYFQNAPVRMNLTIRTPKFGEVPWNSTNGCDFGERVLGPSAGKLGVLDVVKWPTGTVSERLLPLSGHFRISTICKLPTQAEPWNNRLIAIPEIF